MRTKSKGISPLVAVIMLIAFTMIVAGILAGWATRFASEQRATLEKCVRANLIVKKAIFTTNATDNWVTLMLYNPGQVPLTKFQVQVTYNSLGPALPSTWTIDGSVAANAYQTFMHNLSDKNIDYIEIRSVECQGAYDMIRSYDITGITS